MKDAVVKGYRKLPRAYDLHHIELCLDVLHKCPIPLIQIESRSLRALVQKGAIPQDLALQIEQWKLEQRLRNSDESEYRYLLRDLGLVQTRKADLDTDIHLPLGGSGPCIGPLIKGARDAEIYYLSNLGETLYSLAHVDRPSYEAWLFWLILRNKRYLPLLQQLMMDPRSYMGSDVRVLVRTLDSTSKNCVLHWLTFFGVIEGIRTSMVNVESLARHILMASVLEINHTIQGKDDFYVGDLERILADCFSLDTTAFNFPAALEIIFKYSDRRDVQGFTSGRDDKTLPDHPNISILRFNSGLDIGIGSKPNRAELLRISNYGGND